MHVLLLSRKWKQKRIAFTLTLTLIVAATVLIGASMESHAADGFWRSSRFNSSRYRSTPSWHSTPSFSTNRAVPVTGYGSNLHRNFVIRQQQQRSQAGGSLINRGNILWRR